MVRVEWRYSHICEIADRNSLGDVNVKDCCVHCFVWTFCSVISLLDSSRCSLSLVVYASRTYYFQRHSDDVKRLSVTRHQISFVIQWIFHLRAKECRCTTAYMESSEAIILGNITLQKLDLSQTWVSISVGIEECQEDSVMENLLCTNLTESGTIENG